MMNELRNGERCLCEPKDLVGIDLSTVSKHLTVLRIAGLVKPGKRGSQMFYRSGVLGVGGFLDCVTTVANSVADEHLELLESL